MVAASPQVKKRGAAGAAGCVEGLWKKVLKIDRPLAGGFGGLTGPFRAEGCSGGSAAAKKIQRPAGVIICNHKCYGYIVCTLILFLKYLPNL